jgi:serine/threonine protein kinase
VASAEGAVIEEPAFHNAVERIKAIGREPTREFDSSGLAADAPTSGRLREYRLLSRLGAGGMGTVSKALHTRLQRVVALKVLPVQHRRKAAAISRFQREIEAVGKLDHANVVRAFGLIVLLLAGLAVVTVVTPDGELTIETNDPNVQVEVRTLDSDTRTGRQHSRSSGKAKPIPAPSG